MQRILAALLCVCGVATVAHAQTITDERVWFVLNAQGRMAPQSPWHWSGETVLRSRDGVQTFDLLAFRPTILKDLSKRSAVGGGYLWSGTYPDGGGVSVEHRAFEQYSFSGAHGAAAIGLRTRLEQRWLEGNDRLAWRLRQQLRIAHPLHAGSQTSLVASDELFLHLNDSAHARRGVDQNRIFGGVSQAFGHGMRFEIGYLNHLSPGHAGSHTKMNHVLSASLTIAF